jgi:hypothetical protein
LRSNVPCEFLRKAISLHEVDRWKASEFWLFLLYTGPVVWRDCLPSPQYQNFLLLFVGIYCLSSPVVRTINMQMKIWKFLYKILEGCMEITCLLTMFMV